MPEKCRFYTVEAMTAETAYRGVCSWYSPEKLIAIMDAESGSTVIFKRQLDASGNFDKIERTAAI